MTWSNGTSGERSSLLQSKSSCRVLISQIINLMFILKTRRKKEDKQQIGMRGVFIVAGCRWLSLSGLFNVHVWWRLALSQKLSHIAQHYSLMRTQPQQRADSLKAGRDVWFYSHSSSRHSLSHVSVVLSLDKTHKDTQESEICVCLYFLVEL